MTFYLNKIYNIFHFLEYKTEAYKYTLGIDLPEEGLMFVKLINFFSNI